MTANRTARNTQPLIFLIIASVLGDTEMPTTMFTGCDHCTKWSRWEWSIVSRDRRSIVSNDWGQRRDPSMAPGGRLLKQSGIHRARPERVLFNFKSSVPLDAACTDIGGGSFGLGFPTIALQVDVTR